LVCDSDRDRAAEAAEVVIAGNVDVDLEPAVRRLGELGHESVVAEGAQEAPNSTEPTYSMY
jgi:hypothetical protein